ncbi:MAG: flagellar filament capping protein FliD [Sporomusaceae bacterium]|nr:flagellar filament capping protein FliD [Sporomusaceae bacterium]
MSKIPAIVYNNTLRTYRPRDKEAVVISGKKTVSSFFDLDKEFTHVKLMSNLSVRGFVQKQDAYRQQIVVYGSAGKDLGKAADIFANPFFLEEKNIAVNTPEIFNRIDVNPEAKVAEYDVKIDKLALSQINEGKSFPKEEFSILSTGLYTFSLDSFGKPSKQATVYLTENDTMKRVIQKFANVINAVGSDIAAQVKEEKNKVYLYLAAKDTGIKNSFAMNDINGSAVEELGFNYVVQASTNLQYSVNGEKREASYNVIDLDNGNVSLSVKSITDGDVKVSITRDFERPLQAIGDIVSSYNNLQDILAANNNLSNKGKNLLAGMTILVEDIQKEELENIGIKIDKELNLMLVDEDKFLEKITNDPDTVKLLLSDKPGLGVISKSLSRIIQENPLSSFVKTPTMLDSIDYGWRWRSVGSLGIMSFGIFAGFNQGMFFDKFI